MAARVLLLVLALAAAGFLAFEEHGARAAAELSRRALDPHGTPAPADLARAAGLERTARQAAPDTQPTVDLAILQGRARRFRASGDLLGRVTREEPANARAWTLLGLVAQRYDSDLAATARERARALAPPVARRGSLSRSSGRSTR